MLREIIGVLLHYYKAGNTTETRSLHEGLTVLCLGQGPAAATLPEASAGISVTGSLSHPMPAVKRGPAAGPRLQSGTHCP